MKKYFMKDSNKEIKFGDMVEIDFIKDLSNGSIKHCHMECKFLPELLPIFLDCDVIEEVEVEEGDFEGEEPSDIEDRIMDTLDNMNEVVKDIYNSNEEVLKAQEDLELRVDQLEGIVQKQQTAIEEITKIISLLNNKIKKNAKKTA